MDASTPRRVADVAALDQPRRRDVYAALGRGEAWSTRDDVAAALGITRSVAAFHLDRLAEAGLVEVAFARTNGRTGPGAGRPSKLYRVSPHEVSVSLPDRRYDLAGDLLAAAVDASAQTGRPVAQCLRELAVAQGARLAARLQPTKTRAGRRQAVVAVLTEHGYEPQVRRGGEIVMLNCPYHRLAEAHRDVVCGMNLDLLAGLADALGDAAAMSVRLDASPGYCCVRISS